MMAGPWEKYQTEEGPWQKYSPQPLSSEAAYQQEMGSVVRGIPILGADEPQMGAAVSAAAQPLTGVGEKGGTWRERYEAHLKKYMAEGQQFQQEHPNVETMGNITGGLV